MVRHLSAGPPCHRIPGQVLKAAVSVDFPPHLAVGDSRQPRRKRVDPDLRSAPLYTALPALLLFLAAGLWYVLASLGVWLLIVVVLAFVLRALFTCERFPRTAFDGPLALFLLAAVGGTAVSVDRLTAFGSTLYIYIGAVVMYYAVAVTPERLRAAGLRVQPLRLWLLLLPSVIALYFLLTTDWQVWQDKVSWLGPLLPLLKALGVPALGHLLHPNVAGGLIAAMLPLQIGALRWRNAPTWLRGAGGVLLALSLFGLLVSSSRSAWLGLLLAGALLLATRLFNRRRHATQPLIKRRSAWGWAMIVAAGLACIAITVAAWSLWSLLPLGDDLMAAFRSSRLTLWGDTVDLVLDTPLTGIGFGGFQMAYVAYVLLMHVGFQPHSHNMLLEIWLRQGVAGLLAFGWLAVTVWRLRGSPSWWRPWALASLAVIVIHGIFDTPLYGARGMMLAFIPLALLVRAPGNELVNAPLRSNAWLAAAGALVAAALLLVTLPAGRSLIQSNLAALQQTRAELALYRWPDWPVQDELRRSGAVDVGSLVARYQAALAENPRNATANRRLGQIELALGEYDAARQHLEAAYAVAPGHRATRQLLAESYAIAGDQAAAVPLLRTVDISLGQMNARTFWYHHIGDSEREQRLRQVIEAATSR